MSNRGFSPSNIQFSAEHTTAHTNAVLQHSQPTAGPSTPTVSPLKRPLNAKKRTVEESDLTKRTRARSLGRRHLPLSGFTDWCLIARLTSRLASDHTAVLCPDVDTPFVDTVELVNRLLPYHVFQQPKEDLEHLKMTSKGKGRAIVAEDPRKEIAGKSL